MVSEKLRKMGRWGAKHPFLAILGVVALCAGLLLVVWALWPSTAPVWSGIQQGANDNASRTLWDWLELLIIPAALLVAAWWIVRARHSAGQGSGVQSGLQTRPIDALDDRYQEGRLQAYYNRIGRLLLDHGLRDAEPGDEVRKLARAQTLTVLWGLNGERKGALTRFLHEAELILNPDPVISLAGANLSTADLHGANLSDSNLRQAQLIKANLKRAQLDKTDLAGANLSGADLRGALSADDQSSGKGWTPPNLSNANLDGVVLRQAYLRGIDLTNTSLHGANLERADLQEAILCRCGLGKANLSGAKLRRTNLRHADLSEARLTGADLSGAIIVDAMMAGADLQDALGNQANFKGSDLSGSVLARSSLANAFLQECDLREADLSGANLRGSNLSGADLAGARLNGADLRGAYLSGATISEHQLAVALSFDGATLPDNSMAGRQSATADVGYRASDAEPDRSQVSGSTPYP